MWKFVGGDLLQPGFEAIAAETGEHLGEPYVLVRSVSLDVHVWTTLGGRPLAILGR